MKDYLLDIVQHTYGLGGIELAKITGDENGTKLNSISEDRTSVVIEADFKNAIPDFIGTFGLPNLGRLHTLLGLPVYKEEAKLSVNRNNDEPSNLHFENKEGDFQNDYRFMGESVVNSILKNFKFKDVTWNIDIVPTVTSIQRLKFMSQAHPDETTFSPREISRPMLREKHLRSLGEQHVAAWNYTLSTTPEILTCSHKASFFSL